jgi:hypothetical protein
MSRADLAGRFVVFMLLASATAAHGQDATQLGDDWTRMRDKLPRADRHQTEGQHKTAGAKADARAQDGSRCPATAAPDPCKLVDVLEALHHDVEMVRKIHRTGRDRAAATNLRARLQAEIAARLKEAANEKDPMLRRQLLGEVDARLVQLKELLDPGKPDDDGIERLERVVKDLRKAVEDGAPKDRFDALRDALSAVLAAPSSEWRLPINSAAQHQALEDASTVDVAAYLTDAHAEYGKMKDAVHCCERDDKCKSKIADVQLAKAKLDGSLHNAMDEAGLRRAFTGTISVATGFSRVGDGKAETATAQAALVRFESRHFKWRNVHRVDALHFAIAGRLGVKPAFTMVKPKATSFTDVGALRVVPVDPERTGAGDSFDLIATTDSGPLKRRCKKDAQGAFVDCETDPATPVAKFQPAFVWDLGVQAGIPLANRGELGGFWRKGQTFVTSEATVVDTAKPPALGITAGASAAARFYDERGLRLVIFKDGRTSSHELSVLRPVFEFEYGWRYDNRFRDQKDLEPFSKEFGTRPHRRRVLRIALSGLPVFGDGDTPFSLSFAIDHEWANGTGLPGGTRVYVQGDLDLLKLFK